MQNNKYEFETIYVQQKQIACDGGGGAVGHPRVYLTIYEETHQVVCPYCSRKYILADEHRH